MRQPVGGRAEDHTLGEPGAATADDHHVRLGGLTYRQKPAHGIPQLPDGLVVDTLEVELIFELPKNPLLAFDESRRQ